MYMVLWEFHVVSGKEQEFQLEYGDEGSWVQLFHQDPRYLGTSLARDLENTLRFVTLDFGTAQLTKNFGGGTRQSTFHRIGILRA